jgi:hypothetical protein
LAGQRLHRDPDPEWTVTLSNFAIRIKEILNAPLPLAGVSLIELKPRLVRMSAGAERVFYEFSDAIEKNLGPVGRYAAIADMANKAAENAARLALVLALFDDLSVKEISEEHMNSAAEICHWHTEEALRLLEALRSQGVMADADALLQWILASGFDVITKRDLMRNGPSRLRAWDRLRPLLDILIDHAWLRPLSNRKDAYSVNRSRDTATSATS